MDLLHHFLHRRCPQNALLPRKPLHRVQRVHAAQIRGAHDDLVALVDGARHARHKLLEHVRQPKGRVLSNTHARQPPGELLELRVHRAGVLGAQRQELEAVLLA